MYFHGKIAQICWTVNVSIFTCFQNTVPTIFHLLVNVNFWVVIYVLICSVVKVQIVV